MIKDRGDGMVETTNYTISATLFGCMDFSTYMLESVTWNAIDLTLHQCKS